MKKMGLCNKCQTKWSELFEYNGMWLCKSNGCLDEEVEKNSSKAEDDLDFLDQYRNVVASTKNIPPSTY